MKTAIEIIDETVEFYKNNPRSLNPKWLDDNKSMCLYVGPNGERCAFSRCCKDEVLSDLTEGEGAETNLRYLGRDILKEEYQNPLKENDALSIRIFWGDIQWLHDCNKYWNNNTLTEEGENYVEYLKEKYA